MDLAEIRQIAGSSDVTDNESIRWAGVRPIGTDNSVDADQAQNRIFGFNYFDKYDRGVD